jgi:uncharacterized protein YigE (DUF2233 family)
MDRAEYRDCLQAGPLLIRNGKAFNDSSISQHKGYQRLAVSKQEQSFVCIRRDGEVVLGVSDKMNLATLVDSLLRPEIGCIDAMRLTGQATAGLR